MKVYLAGPMSGMPQFNFPAFDRAAEMLEAAGHDVLNPADMDRELGFDPCASEVADEFIRSAMKRDLAGVCDAEAIAMLPGWEHSGGARVEWTLATYLGLEVIYLQEV